MEVVSRVLYPELPGQVKAVREAQGLSQQSLAVSSGLSIGVIRKVEQGVQSVEVGTITRISAALSTPLEALLGRPVAALSSPVERSPGEAVVPPLAPAVAPVERSPASSSPPASDPWGEIISTYNTQKPSLWAACRGVSAKRQRPLRPLLKEWGRALFLERLTAALQWAAADAWWSSKALDFDTLLRENRLVSWSERWESQPAIVKGVGPSSFSAWYERAKGEGLIIASYQEGGVQWVVLPDSTPQLYTELVQAHPLND